MSARSKDMIGAALISAGIPMAAEIHLAAGGTTGAFVTYWADWFENDRYHNSTNAISVGYAALVEGRGDVLIVAPGDHTISTGLVWSKDLCHMIGGDSLVGFRPRANLRPGGSAVTTMLTADATGSIFAGIKMTNAAVTASSACVETFKTSTNSRGTVARNCYFYGPDDATVAAATGGWCLIKVDGGDNYFENCLVGYGWPLTGDAATMANEAALVRFKKGVFNASQWLNCLFQAEFQVIEHSFLNFEYAPAGGVFHIFRNCQFYNSYQTAITAGIVSDQGPLAASTYGLFLYFDSDCAFKGAADVAVLAAEGHVKFAPSHAASSDGLIGVGLAVDHDVS